MIKRSALLLAVLFGATPASAADDDDAPYNLSLDLPVADLPYDAIYGLTSPSMRQSLAATKDLFYAAAYLMERPLRPDTGGFWHRLWTRALIAFVDEAIYAAAPLGGGWMHEEWHRAVMTRRHTKSFNGIYHFAGGDFTSVDDETDADLARMKDEHNPDFVRLAAAGMESEHMLATELEKDTFFRHTRTWNAAQLFITAFSPYFYLEECASTSADTDTAKFNAREGTNVAVRDFTGLDCDAWAYDLFHEDEKYEARGPHPSGVGIDRYRKWSDLAGEPQGFLKRQKSLELLNFADPFLLGIASFQAGGARWNANARHYLTSFGYAVDGSVFVETPALKGVFTLHNYWNHERYFPGLEAQTYGWLLPFETDLRAAAWLQPKDQKFFEERAKPGGLLDVTTGPRLESGVRPYVELVGKTAGWVAGNVYLEPNVSVQLGVSMLAL